MTDLNHMHERIKKHDSSAVHMNNMLNLAVLGQANIQAQLDSGYRRSVELHNERVTKNRYILNIIINCVRFCGAFELALRGHDENDSSSNPGIFRGLINFSSELDLALKEHLERATVFKGTSNTIQNEILQAILDVCQDEISKEIKNADFLAVMADETTDVSNATQLVVIFRYIVNGKPVERFWAYKNPSQQNAQSLYMCIKEEIDGHVAENPNKLVAQTYDGCAVMSGCSNGVQKRIKEFYPNAQYIHCHAHQLNLIMANAASINRHVRIFFASLAGFCTFFLILLGEL